MTRGEARVAVRSLIGKSAEDAVAMFGAPLRDEAGILGSTVIVDLTWKCRDGALTLRFYRVDERNVDSYSPGWLMNRRKFILRDDG